MTPQEHAALVVLIHEAVGIAIFTFLVGTIAMTLLWEWFESRRRRKEIK